MTEDDERHNEEWYRLWLMKQSKRNHPSQQNVEQINRIRRIK
jgi:hypothetical protein